MKAFWTAAALALAAPPVAASPAAQTISYGSAARQQLDYYAAPKPRAPLVVFIHGGAWQVGDKAQATGAKPGFFTAHGFAFATINYRMVPDVDVGGEARDVAAAIAALRRQAAALGFDPDRIALVGHSAGAHLAALVATDPRYLREAGVPLASVRAVSLLDGAGYDVPRQMTAAGPFMQRMYRKAFGTDAAAQRALSPTLHAAAPNAGAFQIFYITRRKDSGPQADALAAALKAAGTPASVVPVPDISHRQINQEIGAEDDPVGPQMLAFFDANMR